MMKYIIFESEGLELPIIFPETMFHKDVTAGRKVVSAGFVMLTFDNKVKAGGYSMSLEVSSRPEDAALIEKFLKER